MQHSTYDWQSRRGIKLWAQLWQPDTTPDAVICLVHGQSDHSGRYVHVAEYFVQRNMAVFAIDLRGHGLSGGQRGHIPKFNAYLENVELLKDKAFAAFPGVPLYIYGHSMGGNIALNQAYYTKDPVAGYIITSPWIRLAFEPPKWKNMLGSVAKTIYPALTQPTGLDAALLSHDPEVVEAYTNDPLVHGKITVGAYFEIVKYGRSILTHVHLLHYPVLLIHGSGDQVTSHLASRELAEKNSKLITYKEFEGMYHETQNEPDKKEVLDTIFSWIVHINATRKQNA